MDKTLKSLMICALLNQIAVSTPVKFKTSIEFKSDNSIDVLYSRNTLTENLNEYIIKIDEFVQTLLQTIGEDPQSINQEFVDKLYDNSFDMNLMDKYKDLKTQNSIVDKSQVASPIIDFKNKVKNELKNLDNIQSIKVTNNLTAFGKDAVEKLKEISAVLLQIRIDKLKVYYAINGNKLSEKSLDIDFDNKACDVMAKANMDIIKNNLMINAVNYWNAPNTDVESYKAQKLYMLNWSVKREMEFEYEGELNYTEPLNRRVDQFADVKYELTTCAIQSGSDGAKTLLLTIKPIGKIPADFRLVV